MHTVSRRRCKTLEPISASDEDYVVEYGERGDERLGIEAHHERSPAIEGSPVMKCKALAVLIL